MTHLRTYFASLILATIIAPLLAMTITTKPAYYSFAGRDHTPTEKLARYTRIILKHSGAPIKLNGLILRWTPAKGTFDIPTKLTPLLYHEKHNAAFAPLDDALVENGTGHIETDATGMTILFQGLSVKIISQHEFSLVIQCAPATARILKAGTFSYSDTTPLQTTELTRL